MWDGPLEDVRVLTAEELVAAARRWCTTQRIVAGHADHATVTLTDVRATPAQRPRGGVAGGRAAVS